MWIARRPTVLALLALCLAFRIAFGLASNFWTEDERQIYLIGLQAFARHTWPYYGADIVWTASRLPGALQGLLIAVPLSIARAPESPFILLNLLTFGALAGFASYLSRRLPSLPGWLVWGWLMTAPWTLHFGTHVVNTSYELPGAIAFFVGFFEAMPALSAGLLSPVSAWALMGFGLFWMMQFHLSWVLLPAYMLVALVATLRRRALRTGIGTVLRGVVTGATVPLLLMVPTWLRGGLAGSGGVERNIELRGQSAWTLVTILAQFLSFASTEISRFLGLDTAQRLVLLASHVWLLPLALVLLTASVAHPVFLVFAAVRARLPQPEWPAVRSLAAGTVAWVYISYAFSTRAPQAHAFYTVFPVATLFALYVWSFYIGRPAFRKAAAVLLAVNVAFHAGFALVKWPERSLYRDRALVVHAIRAAKRPVDRRTTRRPDGGRRGRTVRAAGLRLLGRRRRSHRDRCRMVESPARPGVGIRRHDSQQRSCRRLCRPPVPHHLP